MTETDIRSSADTAEKKSNFIKKYNEHREKNSEKFKWLNLALMVIFPIFITCMAEINQCKKVGVFADFVASRPSVFLFDILAAELIFAGLICIFRKGWIAALIHGFVYMALSITELFKYGTNGNHLILSDMKLIRSAKSLKSFAYIRITPALIIYCIIVVAFILLIFELNPKLPRHIPIRRAIVTASCTVIGAAIIMLPAFYNPVYKFFGLDTTAATNAFILNEKFDNNSFLAFLLETASES